MITLKIVLHFGENSSRLWAHIENPKYVTNVEIVMKIQIRMVVEKFPKLCIIVLIPTCVLQNKTYMHNNETDRY